MNKLFRRKWSILYSVLLATALIPIQNVFTPLPQISGIIFTVSVDKTFYNINETVTIFITAINPTPNEVILRFSTTCQASYIIRKGTSFWFQEVYRSADVCGEMLTHVTISPYSSHTWTKLHQSTRFFLESSVYLVEGVVIGYGYATTIMTVGFSFLDLLVLYLLFVATLLATTLLILFLLKKRNTKNLIEGTFTLTVCFKLLVSSMQ